MSGWLARREQRMRGEWVVIEKIGEVEGGVVGVVVAEEEDEMEKTEVNEN